MVNKYVAGGFVGGLFVAPSVDIVAGIGLGLTDAKKSKDFGKGLLYSGVVGIVTNVALLAVLIAFGVSVPVLEKPVFKVA